MKRFNKSVLKKSLLAIALTSYSSVWAASTAITNATIYTATEQGILDNATVVFEDGKITAIPGHSMPLAAIGVFLLWFGWYGFNGGSVLSADPNGVSLVFVTTSLAAAAGGVAAFFVSYFMFKSYDLSMVLNGILGGLVGVTAGADSFTGLGAIAVGAIAGIIIPFSIVFFDKTLKIDDPVGATSVHLSLIHI